MLLLVEVVRDEGVDAHAEVVLYQDVPSVILFIPFLSQARDFHFPAVNRLGQKVLLKPLQNLPRGQLSLKNLYNYYYNTISLPRI